MTKDTNLDDLGQLMADGVTVQSTAILPSTPEKVADSVPSVAPGLLHGVGGRFVATGGGGLAPASDET